MRAKARKEALPAPAPRRTLKKRITRRSGYAFSHSQGYGALVMSQKFLLKGHMRRLALFDHRDSPMVQNQPQHYRTITEESESQSP